MISFFTHLKELTRQTESTRRGSRTTKMKDEPVHCWCSSACTGTFELICRTVFGKEKNYETLAERENEELTEQWT